MQKKLTPAFITLILVVILPVKSYATLINYNVSGTLENDNTQLTISGNMIIDDTLRLWADSRTPGEVAPLELGSLQYSYFISEYSFSITETSSPDAAYSFSGTAGSFYMERSSNGWMGDLMWFFEDGSGNWTEWTGEDFSSYNEDLTPYDIYNEMHELAPIIRLTDLDYLGDDPIIGPWVNTDILLTQTAPIPEPATILLFGTSLVSLIVRRIKKRK